MENLQKGNKGLILVEIMIAMVLVAMVFPLSKCKPHSRGFPSNLELELEVA